MSSVAEKKGKRERFWELRPPFAIGEQDAGTSIQRRVNRVIASKNKEWVLLLSGSRIPPDSDAGPSHPGFSCPEEALVRVSDRIMVTMGVNLSIFNQSINEDGIRVREYNSFRRDSAGRDWSLAWERGEEKAYLRVKKL